MLWYAVIGHLTLFCIVVQTKLCNTDRSGISIDGCQYLCNIVTIKDSRCQISYVNSKTKQSQFRLNFLLHLLCI